MASDRQKIQKDFFSACKRLARENKVFTYFYNDSALLSFSLARWFEDFVLEHILWCKWQKACESTSAVLLLRLHLARVWFQHWALDVAGIVSALRQLMSEILQNRKTQHLPTVYHRIHTWVMGKLAKGRKRNISTAIICMRDRAETGFFKHLKLHIIVIYNLHFAKYLRVNLTENRPHTLPWPYIT